MEKRKYRFFFHYNKPLSKTAGIHVWSVHFRNKCYISENVECNVTTESKTNKIQPFVVMQGWCNEIKELTDKLIII